MGKLKQVYEAAEMLKELNLPVSLELLKEIVTMFAGENTKQPIGDSP